MLLGLLITTFISSRGRKGILGSGVATAAAAAAASDATGAGKGVVRCPGGGRGGQELEIPDGWINDGYCDCPLDGRDEPDTDACSGSQAWPGVGSAGAAAERGDRYVRAGGGIIGFANDCQ